MGLPTCMSAEAFCRVRGADLDGRGEMRSIRAYRVICFAVAIVLLFASALKTELILGSTRLATAPQSDEAWFSAAGAALEWILATWLLCGVAPAMARRAAMALLGAFVAVSGWRLLHGEIDCGCFGTLHVHPALTFSFDAAALAAIYLFGRATFDRAGIPRRPLRLDRVASALAVSVALPGALLAATSLGRGGAASQPVVLLDPQSWHGKPFPLLDFVDGPARADLLTGKHTVILFNRQCDTCREYLTHLALTRRSGSQAAGVRVMDIAPARAAKPDGFATAFREIRLRQGVLYAVNVPLEVSLKSGVVEEVRRAER